MKRFATKSARNASLFAAYARGFTRRDLAALYGLSIKGVDSLFQRHGVTLDPSERIRRQVHGRKRVGFKNVGRKSCCPDCPPHLRADYIALQGRGMRASEARATLEARA